MDLKGAVAVVIGGTGGLGRRICQALSGAGSHVAVVYAQSRDAARDVARELRGQGVEAKAVQCDVPEPEQEDRMSAQVLERFGRIDILVNDVACYRWIPFDDLDGLTYEEWNKILNVNLTGPMLCVKAVAPAMKQQGRGQIVNISSIAGLAPSGSSIPYAVSKAGLIHLTRCIVVGLVNCIAPGYLEGTRGSANLDPVYRAWAVEGELLKRATDKDDVADQVVALCRTESITGQTLVMDSGRFFH